MDRYIQENDIKEQKKEIMDMLKKLPSDDDRFDILSMFCMYCGSYTDYTVCHCDNDE